MVTGAFSSDAGDRIDRSDVAGYGGGRLAATIPLIRDGATGLEVWVQERVSTMANYPGMTVFPGGGVDARDVPERSWDSGDVWVGPSAVMMARRMGTTKYKAHALVLAAVRELFEETGTLLAVDETGATIPHAANLHEERFALSSHRTSLSEVLRGRGLKVRSDLVVPWARWVGVSESGNWFDTHSFLAAMPRGQTPDGDTSEADDANWFPPALLLDGWRNGLVRLVLPTWAQITELAKYATVAEAMESAAHADLRPVVGTPARDRRYAEFFAQRPIDRIGKYRGLLP